MAQRLDLVLLGATGFTGKFCIPYLQKLSTSEGRNLTWGIAGRSEEKLKQTLEDVGNENGTNLQAISVIVVDIKDEDSIRKMAQRAKVVLNCCGPYRVLGDAVIKACIEAGTHYVDVSSSIVEPQFVERIFLEQDAAAKKAGVYVIPACGIDCVLTDLGIVYLQQAFEGTLNSISTYLEGLKKDGTTPGPISYGTFKSAIYSLTNHKEFIEMQERLTSDQPVYEPKLKLKILPHKPNSVDGWACAFPGSDSLILKRSQRHFYEVDQKRPIQIHSYLVIKLFWHLLLLGIGGLLYICLISFECGRNLLFNYPEIFSAGIVHKKQPTNEESQKYLSRVTFYGEGWKEICANRDEKFKTGCNKCILGRVNAKSSGYEVSGIILVLSAIIVATEKKNMPVKYGVLSPAAAFAKTSLIKQLNANDIVFDIVYQKDLK